VRGQETGAQQDNRAQRAKALTLPSPDLPSAGARRGVIANGDDEILVDQLAESVAKSRALGLGGTGLPLRLAVSDVWALWPAR
jgi:hypothetical protein